METTGCSPLPSAGSDQTYVSISALTGGFITLPEKFFVSPSDQDAKKTVPSLTFLITHPGFVSGSESEASPIQIMFDLGLRSRSQDYTQNQQLHLKSREPVILEPSISQKLTEGGINAATEIDIVVLSHVHYDHHGDPEGFEKARFIVGSESLGLLEHGLSSAGSHQHFQSGILPKNRTTELPPSSDLRQVVGLPLRNGSIVESRWSGIGPFPHALDLLGDGSTFIVDSPGHLPGHLNLLCRTGPSRWVYLGGDSCHDLRLLTGEREIGTWKDAEGHCLCIHLDKDVAEGTIKRIAKLKTLEISSNQSVEIIMAHDSQWLERHRHELFPAKLQQ